ncbi:MAG: hypothetical protein KF861_02745 [Planctomycetaceae bacterium]|nr:hypothetical protein [Planctomycetaceae bacterium]
MQRFTFNAFGDAAWTILLVSAALAAVICIVLLYRYERRLVQRRLGWTLISLRLAAVASVFLVLLEPVLTWTIDNTRTGRVLIAVDVSESMSTADKQAVKAERFRWLRALDLIGNNAVDAQLDRWQEAFDRNEEPEWATDEEARDPQERLELAAVRRQQIEELMQGVERLPRKEIARRIISAGPRALQTELKGLALTELRVFAGASEPVDEQTLAAQIDTPDKPLRTDMSDLFAGMSPAASTSEAPLAGIILFTDGRDNAAIDAERLLARVRSLPAPVYPVMMGSEQRPRDLAIGELESPEMVYQNDAAVLKAQLRTPGFEGSALTVTLELVDRPESRQTQTVTATGRSVSVEFPLDATALGRHRYVLRILPQPGETREDNNERLLTLNVVDDSAKVLLVEGAARWEFRFLDNALIRDPRVHVDQVLFQQPYLGVLPETFFPQTLAVPDDPAPASESPFSEYDVVIIGDVSPSDLPASAWAALEQFVRDEGGTLVLTAGKQHFPQRFDSPVVARLLPIEKPRVVEDAAPHQVAPPAARGFHLMLTPEGARQDFLQFDSDPQTNATIWNALPGHAWGLTGRVKPSATVFAARRNDNEQRGLEFDRNHAVIAHQHAGAGQVLWIGIDSTWRWRHRVGDQYHHRFWGQLVRWAAKFRASAGNEHVRFGPDRPEITVGEPALFRARWNPSFLNQFPNLKAQAAIYHVEDGPEVAPLRKIALDPSDRARFIHEGQATALEPGEYRVELQVENADMGEDTVAAELIVVEKMTSELAELSADRGLLEQIAQATGGRLFLPDEVHEIPELFANVTQHESTRGEVPLWSHWIVLAVCFTLLTIEWVLRKINGLP